MSPYQINQEGYYGEFGGAYVPEILHKCVSELQHAYLNVLEDPSSHLLSPVSSSRILA